MRCISRWKCLYSIGDSGNLQLGLASAHGARASEYPTMSRRDTSTILPRYAISSRINKVSHGPLFKQQLQTTTSAKDPLPPNESPCFTIAAHVAKATTDFNLNRTLTRADLFRYQHLFRASDDDTHSEQSITMDRVFECVDIL